MNCISHYLLHDKKTQMQVLVLASIVFFSFPQIDLWFAKLFYDQATQTFPLGKQDPFLLIRTIGRTLPFIAGVCLFLCLVFWPLAKKRTTSVNAANWLTIVLSGLLGPALIVNMIFKANWGRPRPFHVDEFGGDMPMRRAWEISSDCLSNCSFTSGEASSAFWLLSLLLLLPTKLRNILVIPAFALALVIALNRMAFGRHFFSDTILSALIALLMISLSHWFFTQTKRGQTICLKFERILERLHPLIKGSEKKET